MKALLCGLILFQLFCLDAQAYVPRSKTIVKKMTLNNGRREYKVVREVILQSKDKQVAAREVWTIANGDKMKLQVSSLNNSSPWSFAILYSSKNRKTLSQSKNVKTFKKSPDFFEPLFHDRFHRSLMKRMVGYRFLPSWIADSAAPRYEDGKTKMTPEPFINLSPMEGSVNYAIGSNQNSDGGQSQTALWVEQDSFLIKKGRLRSRAEFVNHSYQRYTGGLKLPNEQMISWGDRTARIKLLAAERIKTKKKDWKLTAADSGTIPSDPLVKEFYSRFR